jgi:hypothetical protein
MTTQEQRNELLAAARELTNALKGISPVANKIINLLITEADTMLPEAADEKDANRGVTTKRIVYKASAPPRVPLNNETSQITQGGRKKRSCGICGASGHDGRNCPKRKKK